MKKAVIYARVSSDLQKKERTIESQIAELKKQIERSGDTLIREYVDNGYSGAQLDRPAMNELRMDLKKKTFETIYILNTDRIARDVTYQNIIIGEMLRHKKQIIINGKDYIFNPENKFTLTVLGAVAELERAKLIERTNRGKQHRLNQGLLLGMGWQTYGYNYQKKTPDSFPSYAINESEAKVVRYIFESYAKGEVSIRSIATQIALMDIPRIAGRNLLKASQIKFILRNEMYTGTRYFNTMTIVKMGDPLVKKQIKKVAFRDRSEWVGIKVPALIKKDLFDRVKKRLDYNMTTYRNSVRKYVLSNLVWCKKCGSHCYGYRRYYKVKRKTSIAVYQRAAYKCIGKNCHGGEIDTRHLELCAFKMIQECLFDPEAFRESISFLKRRGSANTKKIQIQLDTLDYKIQQTEKQKARILDLYASGELEREEYMKRITTYEKEAASLALRQSELSKYAPLFQDKETVEKSLFDYCREAKETYQNCLDFPARRQFALDYIKKVAYERKGKWHMRVSVQGAVPMKIKDWNEPILLDFKIQRTLNKNDMASLIKEQPEYSDVYGNQKAQITPYGELRAIKKLQI